jgi:hypothetical protein
VVINTTSHSGNWRSRNEGGTWLCISNDVAGIDIKKDRYADTN